MKRIVVVFVGLSALLGLGFMMRAQREQETEQLQLQPKNSFQQARRPAQPRTAAAKPVSQNVKPQNLTISENVARDEKPRDMKVASELDRNPQLSSLLKPLLPARTNVTDAAAGFKKQNHFIAALHASRNLGIPFHELKTRMTGDDRMSLKDAVHELRPAMEKDELKFEVKRAEKQAKADEKQAKAEAKAAAEQAKRAANG
jgi:hypothetical protein